MNYRCKNCNKLLFKGAFAWVQIKCPRCKRLISNLNAVEHPTIKESYCGEAEKIQSVNASRTCNL
ncbi:MAG: Com family DNA-binding transcriptional regulator [Scandinavium sp.]|uniref:Com family DNA-binding transcriptional regulator n=1 Tax=Scandinavium sp. TaxID=2830653 RepID=UPI003F34F3F4